MEVCLRSCQQENREKDSGYRGARENKPSLKQPDPATRVPNRRTHDDRPQHGHDDPLLHPENLRRPNRRALQHLGREGNDAPKDPLHDLGPRRREV